jgi:hypothetical protein
MLMMAVQITAVEHSLVRADEPPGSAIRHQDIRRYFARQSTAVLRVNGFCYDVARRPMASGSVWTEQPYWGRRHSRLIHSPERRLLEACESRAIMSDELQLDPALKKAAERAATNQHRSLESLVEELLSDYLRRAGYLRQTSHADEGIAALLTSENDG